MEVYGGGRFLGVIIRLTELETMKQVLLVDEGKSVAERGSLTARQVLRVLFMEGHVHRAILCGGKITIVLDIQPKDDDLEPRRRAVETMKFFFVHANAPFNRSVLKFV